MKGSTPSVPLQDNLTDCGLFTLQYAESFLKKPVVDFHLPITSLKNMFPLEAAKSKRSEIQQIIYKILLETKANIDDLNLPFYYPLQVDTERLCVVSLRKTMKKWLSSSTKGEEVASSSTKGEEVASNRTQDGNKSYNGGVGSDSMKTKKTISQDTMSKPKTCKISSEVSHITIPNVIHVSTTLDDNTLVYNYMNAERHYGACILNLHKPAPRLTTRLGYTLKY
ncbi:unnamed protein product, partial [Timema podura]|nr:unnamed protein product [Timema podura]